MRKFQTDWFKIPLQGAAETVVRLGVKSLEGLAYVALFWASFFFFFYSIFLKVYFLLKDNCFTEFCCFPLNLNMNQP